MNTFSLCQARNALLGALCLIPAASAQPAPTAADERPNILLILVDDLGYGDLGITGSKQVQTPHIDAVFRSGVQFTTGYVTSAVCAPSRAGLLTGKFQNRFGFDHNLGDGTSGLLKPEDAALPLSEKTMADHLKNAGYRTALIGKWHQGQAMAEQRPNARGFDHFFGMLDGNHTYFPTPQNKLSRNEAPVTEIEVPYLTDWFTRDAERYISNVKDEPWFVFLSYNTPHTPMQAKPEDLERFKHVTDKKRQTYLAMQHCLDENVGRLTAHLRSIGEYDNTIIVFLSDNGGPVDENGSINAPFRGRKSIFYEGGLRVPFAMSWPAKLAGGQVYDNAVVSVDLLPTFLEAASVAGREKITTDGVDLIPFVKGDRGNDKPHETICWRMAMQSAAIRDGDWKLVMPDSALPQLFDLSTDPGEQNDLLMQHPETAKALLEKYATWANSVASPARHGSANVWNKRTREYYRKPYQQTQPD
jgi:arylsulfatase A-like enzyme